MVHVSIVSHQRHKKDVMLHLEIDHRHGLVCMTVYFVEWFSSLCGGVIVLIALYSSCSVELLMERASSASGRSTRHPPTPNPTWWGHLVPPQTPPQHTHTHLGQKYMCIIKINMCCLFFTSCSCRQSWQCHTKTCGDFAFITSSSLIATAGQSNDNRLASALWKTTIKPTLISVYWYQLMNFILGLLCPQKCLPVGYSDFT